MNGSGSLSKPQETYDSIGKRMINDFVGRTKEVRDNTVIITQRNAERNELNIKVSIP